MDVWLITAQAGLILGLCFGVFYVIRDVRKVKQDELNRQPYVWYKRWIPICVLAFILMFINDFILSTFFPHDMPERIIGVALIVFSLMLLGYGLWLVRNVPFQGK